MSHRKSLMFVLLTLAFGLVPPTYAATPDLTPLLRVHRVEVFGTSTGLPFSPLIDTDLHQDLTFSQSGALQATTYTRPNRDRGTWQSQWLRGQAAQAVLQRLKSKLIEVQVGQLPPTCWQLSSYPGGRTEITWYSRRGRTNTIAIRFEAEAPPDIDACPPGVATLLGEIVRAELAVAVDPKTQILR